MQAALLVLVAVLAVVVALDIAGVRGRLLGKAGGARAIRMAVLSFESLSHDAGKEYLSGGLTREMTGELARLHPGGLQVIAWTSMKRYKNTTTSLGQPARNLNGVDYVLAGSAPPDGSAVLVALTSRAGAPRPPRVPTRMCSSSQLAAPPCGYRAGGGTRIWPSIAPT